MNDYSLEVAIWSSRIYRMRMKTFLDPSLTYPSLKVCNSTQVI